MTCWLRGAKPACRRSVPPGRRVRRHRSDLAALLPGFCHHRAHRCLIDVQLEYVRTAVVADDVEIELPATDLAQIKRGRQDGFALEMRAREPLAQGGVRSGGDE